MTAKMTAKLIQQYLDDVSTLNTWTKDEASAVIKACDDHYYNTSTTLMSDALYDLLRDSAVRMGIPRDSHVGAKPTGEVVTLPYHCGSADKIKARSKELTRFIKKFTREGLFEFVLSDKLDGMSGTYWRDEDGHHLASRGDGTEGTKWDHLLPYLKLPALEIGDVVRGEVILSHAMFEQLPAPAGGEKKSARHTTAGLVNKLEFDEGWKALEFLAFGFPSYGGELSEQLCALEARDFDLAWYERHVVVDEGIADFEKALEALYTKRRAESDYQIDGLILTSDSEYELVESGNPTYMAAFKMPLPEQMAETVIEYIEWNLSRYNVWVPRVKVRPVVIGGATYNWCHGENARAIVQEGLGEGARIILLRSGDVIPDIYEVLERVEPQLPAGEYEWNATEVDLVLPAGKTDETSEIKQLSHILTEMGMAGMKLGTVKKLYAEGYTTLPKILNLDMRALLDVHGIKERTAQSIFNKLQSVRTEGVPLFALLAASAVFGKGFGKTKAQSVIATVPELKDLQPLPANATIVQRIENSDDFSEDSATKFVESWDAFLAFMATIPMVTVLTDVDSSGIMDDEVIVFTEYRNSDLEDLIESEGGKIGSSVTKKTTRVVTANPTGSTTKLKKARAMGLPIQTPEAFATEFNISW